MGGLKIVSKASKLWEIKKFDKVVKWGSNTIKRDLNTGLWWSKDFAGHGASAWKVFSETKTGLKWYKDAVV